MSFHDAHIRRPIPRPRARAPTALVSGVAALLALAPAAAAGSPAADTDCDGVVDASDDCRAVAEDRDGHDDADGCPDPDNDRDRIADELDQAPDEAEVVNDFQDGDGCPDRAIVIRKARLELEQKIHFAFDRAEILPRSHPILDEIAEAVREHPEVSVIRIQGHADDQGSIGYNLTLSTRRAMAEASDRVRRTAWRAGAETSTAVQATLAPPPWKRAALDDDLIPAANARARPELDDWTATFRAGFEL